MKFLFDIIGLQRLHTAAPNLFQALVFLTKYSIKDKSLFIYFSGGLPAGLHFGPTGVSSPVNTGTSSSSATQPTSSNSTNDPNNYAGVFAQMLNMMSNQNIVC